MPKSGMREGEEKDPGAGERGPPTDQGGFEDQGGSKASGGGLGQGGLEQLGSEREVHPRKNPELNERGRSIEDEAGYDELKDIKPGSPNR